MFKLERTDKFVVFNLYIYVKIEQVVKEAFLFNILTSEYDCREGSLRP